MRAKINKKSKKASKSQKISEYITLKLEQDKTYIYIAGKRFLKCIRLILEIPTLDIHEFDELDSIDEIEQKYNHYIWKNRIMGRNLDKKFINDSQKITCEQEFWGHCSNLQAWVEHGYDTRILHRNIAFPLLRELAKAGDKLAKIKFKEEVIERFLSGYPNVVNYLIEMGYLSYLNLEEFELVLDNIEDFKPYSNLIEYFKEIQWDSYLFLIYRKYLEIHPFDLYVWSELAEHYLKQQIYDKALNAVANALKIDETFKPALIILEKIFRKRKIDLCYRFRDKYVHFLMYLDREQDRLIEKTKTYRRYKSRLSSLYKK